MSDLMAQMRGLCVELGGTPVLKSINADLRRREITAIIGLNGAGKTTLLRALLGEVPWTGELRFFCKHDPRQPTLGHIGYVPQRLRVEGNLPLTVYDLFGISLNSWPWFLPGHWGLRERVHGYLAGVGVAHLIDRPITQMSGGQLQRVLLALALVPVPELLLLDEPAAGIDFQQVDEFYELIGRINREQGVTVLLVSHDLSLVGKVANHVWCLTDGRIECQGAPVDLLSGEALSRIFGKQHSLFIHRPH
jgi:zinc transport system ATP-binding protein